MPPGIDMQLIQEALARRAGGDAPAGGGGMPALDQMSMPMGSVPTGGPNTPGTPPTAAPPTPGGNLPPRPQVNRMMKGAQAAQGPSFDDETKQISKSLITNLLKYV